MKLRLTFLASIAIAISLALVGVLKDVNPTRANMPRPVQPFAVLSQGGIDTNQLGGLSIGSNYTVTQALKGERVTLPWIYSGAGFSVDRDADYTDGTDVGDVSSEIDVNCDGGVDSLQNICSISPPSASPLTWLEATTNVAGTSEDFLIKIMPPFTWLLRHKVQINYVCVGGGTIGSPSVLNTVYANIPFSPVAFGGNQAFVAQTQLGGSPDTPPSKVCLDSPQTSTSITHVYNTPPLRGKTGGPAGVGGRDMDDGSGLYARWTIFGSRGSSSLNLFSDLRKSYQSPPSLPSDTGYVERIVQLECFWIDDTDCGTACRKDSDNSYMTPDESMWDPDLLAMTGTATGPLARAAIDKDGDCLMNSNYDQPGWPAIDAADDPTGAATCGAADGWVAYSENPVAVSHNKAEDQDCDGLVDGIEWFWGGSNLVNDAKDFDNDGATDFVEMFQFTDPTNPDTDGDGLADKPENNYIAASYVATSGAQLQCAIANNWDDDGDGRVNDGCPAVGGAEGATSAICADNDDDDGDGFINDGCPVWPTSGGTAEGTLGEKGEAKNLDDNCPGNANPDQLNSDAQRRFNGPISNLYASNPNQDKQGDACDWDNDNDGAGDPYELAPCANAVDDDGDDATNDGCPAHGAAETVCTGAVDEDADGFINDGCPAAGKIGPPLIPVWPENTDILKLDTDGDTVNDGAEWRIQNAAPTTSNPLDPALFPGSVSATGWKAIQQVYYRGCQINVNNTYSGFSEQDGTQNGQEMDVDGDSNNGAIASGICPTDKDSDNGTNGTEILDSVEAWGYNLTIANVDSDGDLCPDFAEIMDVNGDRNVNVGDQLALALYVPLSDPVAERIYNVNLDSGGVNVGDQLLMALNACDVKTGCDPCTAGEN
jgi:hypothetical protein